MRPRRCPRRSLAPPAPTALLLALLAAALAPVPARAESDAGEPPRSLARTVAGMERIPGFLTFYRAPGKLYLELPSALVGAPLGFTAVLVQAAGDWQLRDSTAGTLLVAWERAGDRLVLVAKNLDFRSAPGSPLASAVAASFPHSPLFLADLVPVADRPAPLLADVRQLFGPDLAGVLQLRPGYSTQPEEAALVSLRSFPDNVVARVTYRFRREEKAGGEEKEAGEGPRASPQGRLADPRFLAVTIDYSFFRLPEDDYRPRRADERIGVFPLSYKDYTDVARRDTAFHHLARRWDVRPRDPGAPRSPAVEPITFYIDSAVPAEWRPLVRTGVLLWNQAFAKAGIEGAVRVLDRPADPDWDPADLHHSMIYWNLTDDLHFSGTAGPHLWDPRTGKVLKANVYLNGEFPSFALHRYLVYSWWRAPEPRGGEEALARERQERQARQARQGGLSHCDRSASFSSQIAFARLVLRARGLLAPGTPEADRFAREAFVELVAHEVGHALGFPHNWKASLVGKAEEVAAGKLTGRAATGIFSTSVMDYDPIYLAPRGAPQGDYFLQEVGPYDELAVEYLYRAFPPGTTPEQEARALDAIAARAEIEPGLLYDGGELNDIDPTTNADDFGDDPLAFAETRLTVLRQEVLPRLPELVLAEGHDFSLIRQALDAAVFSVALDYVDMIARHVGGQVLLRRVANSPAAPAGGPPPVTPVALEAQRRALAALDRQVFADGAFALPPAALATLKADLLEDWNYRWRYASDYDLASRIAGLYEAALRTLFQPARLARVLDNERRTEGTDRFTLPELFGHLEESAFGTAGNAPLSRDRRALQRLLVAHLAKLSAAPPAGTPAEASQVAAATLRSIGRRLDRALGAKRADAYTRAHAEDLAGRIRRTLEAVTELPPGS